MDKRLQMLSLRKKALAIAEEHGCGERFVMGDGYLDSTLLIIGEAPGAREAAMGIPFIGPSGEFLTEELARMGHYRQSVYLTNVVKCRPVRVTKIGAANRLPTHSDMELWKEIVDQEIEIVSPTVILCLGNSAASCLIHPGFRMGLEHGIFFYRRGYTFIATYHPAYVTRFSKRQHSDILQQFRNDLHLAAAAAEKKGRVGYLDRPQP